MDFLRTLLASAASLLLRLLVVVFSLVFLASLVVAGLVAALVLSVWALLRGRRPTVADFGLFRRYRWTDIHTRTSAWTPGRGTSRASGGVIDVEARELPPRQGDASPRR